MTLREKRVLFTKLKCELILDIQKHNSNWEIAEDEGRVINPRSIKIEGQRKIGQDMMHIPNSFHYQGLAVDLLLYIDDEYISDGNHSAWKTISEMWKKKHELCTAGIDFNDANHLSFGEGK